MVFVAKKLNQSDVCTAFYVSLVEDGTSLLPQDPTFFPLLIEINSPTNFPTNTVYDLCITQSGATWT